MDKNELFYRFYFFNYEPAGTGTKKPKRPNNCDNTIFHEVRNKAV